MSEAPRLASLAADWQRADPPGYERRWQTHLHHAALRYYLYDNTVAGERYLGLDALVLDAGLPRRLVEATETLGRVFERAARAVQRDRALLERMGFNWAVAEMLHQEPAVMLGLLNQFVSKIRTLTIRVYEFSALAVGNRIQAELLRLANLAPQEGNSARIASAPTHSEIASRISTHREAVTRELNRLARLGLIERKGSALVVKDVRRLTAMVHEITGE